MTRINHCEGDASCAAFCHRTDMYSMRCGVNWMKNIGRWREDDLMEWLKENWAEDLEQMKDTYSRWDCTTAKVDGMVELKCRRKHYPTMLIEKKKYDALMEQGGTPLYINSTPNGIYVWDLSKLDIEWDVEHKHPATTSFGNRARVAKEVGYLDINDAEVLYDISR